MMASLFFLSWSTG